MTDWVDPDVLGTMGNLTSKALSSAKFRGHQKMVIDYEVRGVIRVYKCEACGMDVAIKPRPAPNEINIGGEAVALNCIGGCQDEIE